MKFLRLVLLFIIAIPALAFSSEFESCHYYLNLEKRKGCWFKQNDQSDYFIRYGYKYCSTFQNKLKEWNDERSQWAENTRTCLQDELRKVETKLACIPLEDRAFNSHPRCYADSGFCKLSFKQQTSIVWTVLDLEVFLKTGKSFKQFFKILDNCFKEQPEKIVSLHHRVQQLISLYPKKKYLLQDVLNIEKLSDHGLKTYLNYTLQALTLIEEKPNEEYYEKAHSPVDKTLSNIQSFKRSLTQ